MSSDLRGGSMKRLWIALLSGLFGSTILCAGAWAQATAQISGAVRDQSGTDDSHSCGIHGRGPCELAQEWRRQTSVVAYGDPDVIPPDCGYSCGTGGHSCEPFD